MAIERRLRSRSWVALVGAIALLCSTPALANDPCAANGAEQPLQLAQSDSGISGTGLDGGDDSGIGGTGLSGGDDSGIGGTGIYGTITAFGSICVNGLRVHYDEGTPVEVDGSAASASSLAIGQVVAVDALTHGGESGELTARSVSVHSLLSGPITGIDERAQMLDVMGAPVEVSAEAFAHAAQLGVGSRVKVAGLRRDDGVVEASLLTDADRDAPDAIAGLARIEPNDEIHVGGIALTGGGVPEVAAGDHLRAEGRYFVTTRRFDVQQVSSMPLLSSDVARLSVEGFVHEIGAEGRLFLPGVEVERTSLERATGAVDRATRVRVTGSRDRFGRLRVERLQRVDRPKLEIDTMRARARMRAQRADRPQKIQKKANDTRPTRVDILKPERPQKPIRPRPPERPTKPDIPTVIDDAAVRDAMRR